MLIPLNVYVPTDRKPYVTLGLIALIVVISGSAMTGDNLDMFESLAGVNLSSSGGAFAADRLPLPILAITSSLLHLGWMHLIVNMLFLWIFGQAVEYKFRPLGMLGLYLISGMMGGLAHYAFTDVPAVGASSAVMGLMGAFLVFFPTNDIRMGYLLIFRFGTFTCSAMWVIFMYIGWDILSLSLGWSAGVALWGHVVGFATGFGVAFLCAHRGWLTPEEDEKTLLQVLGVRAS